VCVLLLVNVTELSACAVITACTSAVLSKTKYVTEFVNAEAPVKVNVVDMPTAVTESLTRCPVAALDPPVPLYIGGQYVPVVPVTDEPAKSGWYLALPSPKV
jgi:hypothetical protein